MNIKCLFGYHNWGNPINVRNEPMGATALILPLLFILTVLGPPKICDKKCCRCGKVKTFSYNYY